MAEAAVVVAFVVVEVVSAEDRRETMGAQNKMGNGSFMLESEVGEDTISRKGKNLQQLLILSAAYSLSMTMTVQLVGMGSMGSGQHSGPLARARAAQQGPQGQAGRVRTLF